MMENLECELCHLDPLLTSPVNKSMVEKEYWIIC